ncbi:MAG: phage tail protein [Peptostreptococcaceae bacterium]|jgi:hypothetical protein|nr:phage tail protein [Peptostreptococcaceae bacterium]
MSLGYTYDLVQIAPYEFEKILDINVIDEISTHTKVYIRGIIKEELIDKYVDDSKQKQPFEINLSGQSGNIILFKGFVGEIDIKAGGDLRELEIIGIGATFFMDNKLKKKSYQDVNMLYKEVIEDSIKDYNASFAQEILNGKKIKKIIIRYDETAWNFTKRLASHFNAFIAPNRKFYDPKFYIGNLPSLNNLNLEEFDYKISRNLMSFTNKKDNYVSGIMEQNFTSYIIKTNKILDLCQSINFKGRKLYIYKCDINMQDSIFLNKYYLCDENGLKQRYIYNENIKGNAIYGEVADIKEDKVKVQLDIDEKRPLNKLKYFEYSTIYSTEDGSGWYFMPELKDRIRLYVPENKEELAFVESAANLEPKKPQKRKNPDIKTLCTIHGKEIKFQKGQIDIICNEDLYIRIEDSGGIKVISNKDIDLNASKDINIVGQTVSIKGEDGVTILQNESCILDINKEITASGGKVKME